MDLYDLSFFLSTMWIGPFWIAMLLYPNHEKWKLWLSVFFGVMLMPIGLMISIILVRK